MGTTARWHLSPDAAQLYQEVLVPVMFAPWGRDLLAVAAPAPGERVVTGDYEFEVEQVSDRAPATVLARRVANREGAGE